MNKIWETKLQRFWLIVSGTSLLFPLFLYFGKFDLDFADAITAFLGIMFVVSLPFSLFSLPLIALFKFGIELDINSMFGAYFLIVLLNIFGYLQWFWLMPKYFDRGKQYKLPTILENN